MSKITHISTSRTVQTKNGERKVYEVIVDGHQITLFRAVNKIVNVGDEINIGEGEYNGHKVRKEKSEKENNSERIAKLEEGQKDIRDHIKKISEQLRTRVADNKEVIDKLVSSSLEEVKKIEEKSEVVPLQELQPEQPRMEDIDLLKHDEKLKEIKTYEELKARTVGLKMNTVMFYKFYTRWLSFHKDTSEDCLPF